MRFLIVVGVAIIGGAALPYLRGWARHKVLVWFASPDSAPQGSRATERAAVRLLIFMVVADFLALVISSSPLAVGLVGLPRGQRLWSIWAFAASVCLSFLASRLLKK